MGGAYPTGLLFGSFQPILQSHVETILDALERCARLIVALDGLGSPPSIRRPWLCAQRKAQIRLALPDIAGQRVTFIGLRDHLYRPDRWVRELRAQVAATGADPDAVALVATQDDAELLARRGFGARLRLDPVACPDPATEAAARADYLRGGDDWRAVVAPAMAAGLDAFRTGPGMARLTEEQAWVDRLTDAWAAAPYPPIFVTADAVVVAQGHILLVQRKNAPAKNLWALPGGFVEQGETVAEAALRELVEETGIAVPLDALRRAVRDAEVFDSPERSVRGRTITHGLFIDLGDAGPLPAVRVGDDAGAAAWWPLDRFARSDEMIAEDHAWIVRAFVSGLP
jgi:bifunctional NMN adenylyltransferase/nudix hydrolase